MLPTYTVILVRTTVLRSKRGDINLQHLALVVTAVEHCTLAAFTNLTYIENVISLDPLEYVPSIKNTTEDCILEQGAFPKLQEEFEDGDVNPWLVLAKSYWLSFGPMTVLFGPMWGILFPRGGLY